MFSLHVCTMSASFGGLPVTQLPLFGDFRMLQLHQWVFHMSSTPRVHGMKPVLEITLIQSDSANKHLYSLVSCALVYLPTLE